MATIELQEEKMEGTGVWCWWKWWRKGWSCGEGGTEGSGAFVRLREGWGTCGSFRAVVESAIESIGGEGRRGKWGEGCG